MSALWTPNPFYYAHNKGEAEYPELWDGLVSAWSPGLNVPHGLVLDDKNKGKNNGTLTDMDATTDWITSSGYQALNFDGTNNYVSTSLMNVGYSAGSISWWMYPRKAFNDSLIHGVWGHLTAYNTLPEFDFQKYSNNQIYVGFVNTADDDRVNIVASATNYTQNVWQHYVFRWISGGDSELWRNGIQIGVKSGGTTPVNIAVNFDIGRQNIVNFFDGMIGDFLVWSRQLNTKEIPKIYELKPGGWATPKRRKRVSILVTSRIKNIFMGGIITGNTKKVFTDYNIMTGVQ